MVSTRSWLRLLAPFRLAQEVCQTCLQEQHLRCQSFPADELPHGQTPLLIFFLASVDPVLLNLSDIGDNVVAKGLRGLSGMTVGDFVSLFGLETLPSRTKGLRWRGLCRRGAIMWPRGEPEREVVRLSAFGVFLTAFPFFESLVATMIGEEDLRVCAWCLLECHRF